MGYDILFQQAIKQHELGNLDVAENIYRQILETAPNNPDILNLLGLVAQEKEAHQEAVELFYKAINNSPNYALYHFNLAISLNLWGKPYEAIEAYHKAIELNRDLKEAYNNIGSIYQKLDNNENAKKYYIQALLIDKNYLEPITNIAFMDKDVDKLNDIGTQLSYYYISLILENKGDYDKALEFALKSDNFVKIAELYIIKDNINEAEKYLNLALKHMPNSVSSLINLANIEANKGFYNTAEKKYKKAIEFDSKNIDAHLNYANMLHSTNRLHEALEEYRKATIINPDIAELSNNIGIIQRDLGEYKLALDLFFDAFVKNPENENFAINISETLTILVQEGKREEALEIAKKWHALSPNNIFAERSLAILEGRELLNKEQYNEKLFDAFANKYEEVLEKIEYKLPLKIKELTGDIEGKILDLGCGSGLLGQEIKTPKNTIVGVDLSEKMLNLAKDKKTYNSLIKKDILSFLKEDNNQYEFIFAADVFCYIGDLSEIIKLCQAKSKNICFSIELLDENDGFKLTETGRYKHNEQYIDKILKQNMFNNVEKHYINLRLENSKPVKGMLFIIKEIK